MFEIEKGVPIPASKRGQKYPIKEMQVGDSFLVAPSARTGMCVGFARHGFKCATRAEGDMVRVWRIE